MNKKVVILAEKPKQARENYAPVFEIEKKEKTHYVLKPCSIFPNGAILTWAVGHLVSLKMPKEYKSEWGNWDMKNLPIIPNPFEFKVSEDKKMQFNAVKKLFNGADTIINACDSDREGSNIFYSILKMTGAKNKNIKRLWINSLTPSKVEEGFKNLQDNDKDLLLYEEARTRQIGDWLVGMNNSQLFTLLLKEKGLNTTLSVGRVQSPTVYMVYQRQQEIDNFVSKPYFELIGDFTHENGKYTGKAKVKEESKDNIVKLLEKHSLSDLNSSDSVIKEVTKTLKTTKSPKLHSLTTIQKKADKRWKYSGKKVLKIMQSLYEKKLLTYPRTEYNYITESEYAYLVSNVKQYQELLEVSFEPKTTPDKNYVDGTKVGGHYAIIPTDVVPSKSTIDNLPDEEKKLYYEVLKTTLAMFHLVYKYEETKITTNVNGIEFFTTGKVEVEKGWKDLFQDEKEEEKEKSNENKMLPSVTKEDFVSSLLNIKEGHTSCPKPYTEGQLIELMQKAGKLVNDKEEKAILKEVEGLGTVATRGDIIETIKNNGYIESKQNILNITEKGKILCEALNGTLLASPLMTAKWESYLKKIGEGSGTQEVFLNKIVEFLHSTIEEAPKNFNVESFNHAMKDHVKSQTIGSCPSCGKGTVTDKGKFYGCSEYRNGCKFSLPKTFLGKKLTNTHLVTLLRGEKTKLIKGFKSKKKQGKKFDAYLIVKDGNITFEFPEKK